MSNQGCIKITVPGSSANLGSGFDVLSVALEVYINIEVKIDPSGDLVTNFDEDIKLKWNSNESKESKKLEDPRHNLITLSAAFLASQCKKRLPKLDITCNTTIPVGCGLGSSGASIVAGVTLANEVCRIGLTKQELLQYAVIIEGFGDNVTASMFGGLVVCSKIYRLSQYMQGTMKYLDYLRIGGDYTKVFEYCSEVELAKDIDVLSIPMRNDIMFNTITPSFEITTNEARKLLPNSYHISDVVSALNNVSKLITCLSGNQPQQKIRPHLSLALKDPIHQPYRARKIPGLLKLLELDFSNNLNIIGIYLSGAGPSIQVLSFMDDSISRSCDFIVSKWIEFANNEGVDNFTATCSFNTVSFKGIEVD